MVDDWLDLDSTNLHSHCGDDDLHTVEAALNGTDYWNHPVTEIHYLILDLGASYNIKKFKSHSSMGGDPRDVDLYVSDNLLDWGVAVGNVRGEWEDIDVWVEFDTTDKDGRYIKFNVTETEALMDYLSWGNTAPYKIVDVYGELVPIPTGKPNIPNYFNSKFITQH